MKVPRVPVQRFDGRLWVTWVDEVGVIQGETQPRHLLTEALGISRSVGNGGLTGLAVEKDSAVVGNLHNFAQLSDGQVKRGLPAQTIMDYSGYEHDAPAPSQPRKTSHTWKSRPYLPSNLGIRVIDRLAEVQQETFFQLQLEPLHDLTNFPGGLLRLLGGKHGVDLGIAQAYAEVHNLEAKPSHNTGCIL